MGISGNYVGKFSEGNLASCVDIHLDAHYPHVFFDIVEIKQDLLGETTKVVLKSHWDSTKFEFEVKQGEDFEYAEIRQQCPLGKMLGDKPSIFKIIPMKGKRF